MRSYEYQVAVKLPGPIISNETQKVLDIYDEWIANTDMTYEDYDSFYFRRERYKDGIGAVNFCYKMFCFNDPTIATLFKLTFG